MLAPRLRPRAPSPNPNPNQVPLCARAGVRALPPRSAEGALPLAGRAHTDHGNVWFVGGMGSRGLLYHSLVAQLDSAWSRRHRRARSSPSSYPPLQRPTRLLSATLWVVRVEATWVPKRGCDSALVLAQGRRFHCLRPFRWVVGAAVAGDAAGIPTQLRRGEWAHMVAERLGRLPGKNR